MIRRNVRSNTQQSAQCKSSPQKATPRSAPKREQNARSHTKARIKDSPQLERRSRASNSSASDARSGSVRSTPRAVTRRAASAKRPVDETRRATPATSDGRARDAQRAAHHSSEARETQATSSTHAPKIAERRSAAAADSALDTRAAVITDATLSGSSLQAGSIGSPRECAHPNDLLLLRPSRATETAFDAQDPIEDLSPEMAARRDAVIHICDAAARAEQRAREARLHPPRLDPYRFDPRRFSPPEVVPSRDNPTRIDPRRNDPMRAIPARKAPGRINPHHAEPVRILPARRRADRIARQRIDTVPAVRRHVDVGRAEPRCANSERDVRGRDDDGGIDPGRKDVGRIEPRGADSRSATGRSTTDRTAADHTAANRAATDCEPTDRTDVERPSDFDHHLTDHSPTVDGSCALDGVHPLDESLIRLSFNGVRDSQTKRARSHPHLRLVSNSTTRSTSSRAHSPRWYRITLVCRQRLIRKLALASSLLCDGYEEPSIDHVVELAVDTLVALIQDP
jgi:hypothetical protein